MYRLDLINDLEEFMMNFIDECCDAFSTTDDINELWSEQARCIFTTWCLVNNVDADASACDEMITYLYENIVDTIDIGYDDFYNYMVKYIV